MRGIVQRGIAGLIFTGVLATAGGLGQAEEFTTTVPDLLWQQVASVGSVECLAVLRPLEVALSNATITATQPAGRFEARWEGRATVIRRFAELPIVHLRLDARHFDELARDPEVAGLSPIRTASIQRKEGRSLIKAGDVHARGYRGHGIGIAVLDTGVDYTHSELAPGGSGGGAKTIKLFDAIDNDADPRDEEGHGTSVAGIAAGADGGVAPFATVVAVRVLNRDGEGTSAQILAGLDAVLASVRGGNPHNIRVLNLSLGGYDDDWLPGSGVCDELDPAFESAFRALTEAGVLIVAAAGNGGCSIGVSWPACLSQALAVGAVFDDEICSDPFPMPFGCQLKSLSFGKGQCMQDGCSQNTATDRIACYSDSGSKLGVWAPSHCAKTPRKGGGNEDCFGGTSAAAPYAAGAAALLAQAYPRHGVAALRKALEETGTPRPDSRNNVTRNRINVLAAFSFLATYCTPPLTPFELQLDAAGMCDDRVATLSWRSVASADRYRVQKATRPDFVGAQESLTTAPLVVVSHDQSTQATLYFRVRAERDCDSVSVWSAVVSVPYNPQCGIQVRRHLRRGTTP